MHIQVYRLEAPTRTCTNNLLAGLSSVVSVVVVVDSFCDQVTPKRLGSVPTVVYKLYLTARDPRLMHRKITLRRTKFARNVESTPCLAWRTREISGMGAEESLSCRTRIVSKCVAQPYT